MTRNEDKPTADAVFLQTLIFSMEKILDGTDRDSVQISATRYGRIISGLKNGSRDTLDRREIKFYTYHLELIRRNWPLDSEWICKEVVARKYFLLEFRRRQKS